MKKLSLFIIAISQLTFAQFTDINIIKEVKVQNKGVVVSAHPLASAAGAKILREGGNAFDAAVATQLALAVVYPQAGNIGGGGFLVGYTNAGNQFTIDYRETAPQKATHDMYVDENGKANTYLSQYGNLAVGVPGSVAGFFATLKYGKLPMSKLIEPAIDLAEKGFAITKSEADLLNAKKEDFIKFNQHPIAFVKETPWQIGDILVQKELAETLKRIQKNGAKGFYEGTTAKLIVSEMNRTNGIITYDDLKNYTPKERKPISFNYKGYDIISMPLPSSGGILLAQMLKMSGYKNLERYEHNSPEAVQIMIEAERRAFADRAEFMGDPDFIEDKTSYLISDFYLQQRWKSYDSLRATPSSMVGKIIKVPTESTQTTHISILDKYGNAASITTTLNGLYGSKVVVKGGGFLLNNEMDDFSVKPGVPNMFGAVGGEANAIAPGKRMLSSMTPTIVLKDKKPFMIVGTPGGTTIPTSVYQSIVNIVDFKLNANEAVNAPKFHHQWLPENVAYEKGFPKYSVDKLKTMGYEGEHWNQIGKTEMILSDGNQGITAVADGRGDDSVGIE